MGWYERLDPALRAHLAKHIGVPALPSGVRDPVREAELAMRLAVRTDAVLADLTVREQWVTGNEVQRTMEWMRAVEHWAGIRATALAGRRIERWLAKRDHVI